jgi:hypothetical protein
VVNFCPSSFIPEKEQFTRFIGGWLGHRVGPDVLKKRKISFPSDILYKAGLVAGSSHHHKCSSEVNSGWNISSKSGS